jgi:hypothetical protein
MMPGPPTHLVGVLDGFLGKEIGELLLRSGGEDGWGPQFGGKEAVGLGQGVEDSHSQVSSGTGVSTGRRVHVLNTSHVQQLLGDQRGDDAGTSWSWDQSDTDGTALARHLAWDGVGSTRVQAPVSSADWDKVHLGVDDSTTDGSGNFLGGLNTQANVAVTITDSDAAFKSGALTGRGLLLHRHDLHDFVSQSRAKQEINNLVFLDGKREKEDFLNGLDLALTDKAAKLGDRSPLFLISLATFSLSASATSSTVTSSTVSTSSSTAKASTLLSFVSHCVSNN